MLESECDSARRELASLRAEAVGNVQNRVWFLDKGKPASWTFDEVAQRAARACNRLKASGIKPDHRVGILASNGPHWIVYELALLELGCVTVTLTAEMDHEAPEVLAARYDLAILLVGGELGRSARGLEWVLAMDEDMPGRSRPSASMAAPEADLLTFIFSSGTSGNLKMLRVSCAGVRDVLDLYGRAYSFVPEDRFLLFLPMSNFQQRLFAYASFKYRLDLAIAPAPQLFRALKALQPTILVAPPMFYEAIAAKVDGLPPAKRSVVRSASSLLRRLPNALRQRLRRRLFSEVHAALGGRMRIMITGMAPISERTLQAIDDFGLSLYEAYGVTECGMVAWNTPAAQRRGSVGKPVEPDSVSLAEDGEIIVRKRHLLTLGYSGIDGRDVYVDPHTVRTGDIGRFDADGFLYLVGRKKQLLILSGGEKLHPERVERELSGLRDIVRSVVLGPANGGGVEVVIQARAESADVSELLTDVRNVNRGLPPYARVACVLVVDDEFSPSTGLLTRNLKVDREAVLRRYGATIKTQGTYV